VLKLALRLAAALALLAAAAWLVGIERLAEQLRRVDPLWFVAAVAAAALSQWVSALRWHSIARILGLQGAVSALAVGYAQAITVGVLLPGATLGGDALRSMRLQRLGNPLGVSALSVVLDRLSGLWVLCVLSLVTGLGLVLLGDVGDAAGAVARAGLPPGAGNLLVAAYLLGLACACAAPFLPWRLPEPGPGAVAARAPGEASPGTAAGEREAGAPSGRASAPGETPPGAVAGNREAGAPAGRAAWSRRLLEKLRELHQLTLSRRAALARSLWSSLLVQVLCALTLWLCLRAAGASAGYWQVQAIAAPVFIAGVLPLSYGGFGSREVAALVAFPLVGVPADAGVTASALYGLTAVVLGLAAAPLFALGTSRAPAADRTEAAARDRESA
jgi:hypothetical protein